MHVNASTQSLGVNSVTKNESPKEVAEFSQKIAEITVPSGTQIDMEQAVEAIKAAVEPHNIELNFTKDKESGSIVIRMVDQGSGEMIRQIPNEALVQLAATLNKLQGQVFSRKA
jgi:flagellar protein FlaG